MEHTCPIPPGRREQSMVVVERDHGHGKPIVWCDPCIEPLVRALNAAGIRTEWSCCGHGQRPGVIGLTDGRQLVIAPDDETLARINALFPSDINGTTHPSTLGDSDE